MSELLEKILESDNIRIAQMRVISNRGAGGVDKMTIKELPSYMSLHWSEIRERIRSREYQPQSVLRVEIPKADGGKRKLGIPTVIDRTIQQAISQVLTPIFEATFQEQSYGFRPNRSCEQAIVQLQSYVNEGLDWIVDIDLEKFFDNVPQDRLMSYVGRVIRSGDVESLIRKYLQAGIMNKGVYEVSDKGTPQGGNLSPLLSNIMLNELDKELVRRGLHYVRYADDCVIAVGSEASAKRVMHSITTFIEKKLGLKVNVTKTQITRPNKLKYLGFGFWKQSGVWRIRPHGESVNRFARKLKRYCKRNWSISMAERIETHLNPLICGWINYFAIGDMVGAMTHIDSHLRKMLRVVIWKQWKVPKKRAWGLRKLGVSHDAAMRIAYNGNRYYAVARRSEVEKAISKQILSRKGLVSCLDYYRKRHALKSVQTAVCRTARTVV
jgi:group II intron reverse transcriptase/maturase